GGLRYVELAYANQSKLPVAALKNKDGEFGAPTIDATSYAAAHAVMPDDFRTSITDAPGKGVYPIASFTYLLVRKDQKDPERGPALLRFVWWAIHDGQAMAKPLDYAPLPKAVVEKVEAKVKAMTVQGKTANV